MCQLSRERLCEDVRYSVRGCVKVSGIQGEVV